MFRMNENKLENAIKNYCQEMKFLKSSAAMNHPQSIQTKNLEDHFKTFFDKKSGNKLSFSYAVNPKHNLLKKRLANMNTNLKTCNKKINAKKLQKKNLEKIPESFLILMDELCLDRKHARKFFENPSQWTHVKSDRKIFCTKKGKIFKNKFVIEYFVILDGSNFQIIRHNRFVKLGFPNIASSKKNKFRQIFFSVCLQVFWDYLLRKRL